MYAAENLIIGKYQVAKDSIFSVKFNFDDQLKEKIDFRLKISALKCYLIANQASFVNLTADSLSKRFHLDIKTATHHINNLISEGYINSKWADGLLIFESSTNDNEFKESLDRMEKNIKIISENNITLLEYALKSSTLN